jgi:pimeloyl-ACP methyl ester carboxylesterase
VDVIAVSIGGVVARHAAAATPTPPGRRLRVARLFTISSPHRGAALAAFPAMPFVGGVQADLRPGSKFLRTLEHNERPGTYPVYPYVRLGDSLVGAANAAPHGQDPWWVATPPLEGAHTMAYCDGRIVADIARRLRGEEPFAKEPPEPLPGLRAAGGAHSPNGPSPRPFPVVTGARG